MPKKEVKDHLLVSLFLFLFLELTWLLKGKFDLVVTVEFFLGLLWGTFLLDVDHLLYWFVRFPKLEESKRAKEIWRVGNWFSLLSFLGTTHKNHTSLIFHHFTFQAALLILAFFIFSSTLNIFGKGLILAANAHLLLDEAKDLFSDPDHLKKWLFARTKIAGWPIPFSWLKGYFLFTLFILILLTVVFLF